MKYYVEENVSQRSCTTIRHVIKMLGSISETLIFFFLGVVTITTEHEWNWGYILFTLLFAFVWRGLGKERARGPVLDRRFDFIQCLNVLLVFEIDVCTAIQAHKLYLCLYKNRNKLLDIFLHFLLPPGVLVLTQIINPFRTIPFNLKDQFGLGYGGLRGAISFALAFTLPDSIGRRQLFITATIAIIIFTVFIQVSKGLSDYFPTHHPLCSLALS